MGAGYSQADYAAALGRLLPRGRAWDLDPGGVRAGLLYGLAGTLARLDAAAVALIVDILPATTGALLPEWEASLGLPDPCSGPNPTVEQRRHQVVARFTDPGGQSAASYIQRAAALGYTVTVKNFAPFRAGRSRAGTPLYGVDWAHAWAIDQAGLAIFPFRTGAGRAGEPLRTWGDGVLQCELSALKPAQSILLFTGS